MRTYEYAFVRVADDDGRMRKPKAVEEDLNKNGREGFKLHSLLVEDLIIMEKTASEEPKEK